MVTLYPTDNPLRWILYLSFALSVHAFAVHNFARPSTPPILPSENRLRVTLHSATQPSTPPSSVSNPASHNETTTPLSTTPNVTPNVPSNVHSNVPPNVPPNAPSAENLSLPQAEKIVAFQPRPATPLRQKEVANVTLDQPATSIHRADPSPAPPPPASPLSADTSPAPSPAPLVRDNTYPQRDSSTEILASKDGDKDWEKKLSLIVREARYRKRTTITYPKRAWELGQQGTVTLHAFINSNGLPEDMKIVVSSGHSLLDRAALSAVQSWQFHPALHNGQAITSWVRVPVQFVIQ